MNTTHTVHRQTGYIWLPAWIFLLRLFRHVQPLRRDQHCIFSCLDTIKPHHPLTLFLLSSAVAATLTQCPQLSTWPLTNVINGFVTLWGSAARESCTPDTDVSSLCLTLGIPGCIPRGTLGSGAARWPQGARWRSWWRLCCWMECTDLQQATTFIR